MGTAERLAALFGRRRFTIKPGTERIRSLLDRMGHPEQTFKSIHVVGTNGKGSTAAFLSSMLVAAGHRTGLFTSPHLVRFTERFRIDGVEIPADQLDQQVARLLEIAHPDDTFFELTTALTCRLFADNGVHIAILEAGMGGQADATAAIPAIATLITPVTLDHTQWLGDSVAAIAAEKIAIAEPTTPVICSRQQPEALVAIQQQCKRGHNRLILADTDFSSSWTSEGLLHYHGTSRTLSGLKPGIAGQYQQWNAATALAAAEILDLIGLSIPEAAMVSGIATASWPGRMERFELPNGVTALLDGAHNPAGAQALADSLLAEKPLRPFFLVLGVMEDKDLTGLLKPLATLTDQVITVAPGQDRALPAHRLAALCAEHGMQAQVAGTVAEGLTMAAHRAQPGDLIVVAGSLFTVGEARAKLTGTTSEAVRG